jgi:hypothetical protein
VVRGEDGAEVSPGAGLPETRRVVGPQFYNVPVTGGCNGRALYVRDVASSASAV